MPTTTIGTGARHHGEQRAAVHTRSAASNPASAHNPTQCWRNAARKARVQRTGDAAPATHPPRSSGGASGGKA